MQRILIRVYSRYKDVGLVFTSQQTLFFISVETKKKNEIKLMIMELLENMSITLLDFNQ